MVSAPNAYSAARKSALADVALRKKEKLNPYLPVLDTYLEHLHITGTRRCGTSEILIRRIVGTCHAGRTEAFAANFMPLLEENSEFAAKWMRLYASASEEGLRDSIRVYELYGSYFVEEGNKRVSVMKVMQNPLISAEVIELTVDPADLTDGDLYESYLRFRALTGISTILMSRKRNYHKLLNILGVTEEDPLSSQARTHLMSLYDRFELLFRKKVTEPIPASAGDAFLILLETFGWDPDRIYPDSEIENEFDSIRPAILAWPGSIRASLVTDTRTSDRKPNSLLSFLSEPVRAALIEPGQPEQSTWTRDHDEAFRAMAEKLKGDVDIRIWNGIDTPAALEDALQAAVDWKADVVFTGHPLMLQATNQFAARYPKVRFLNCSLNPESTAVRSYYTRGYELQFLQGMAAGALSSTGKLGYIADYPIYGAIADINAFAIGAMAVRPDVRVYLDWSTSKAATNDDFPTDIDMIYISGQDFDTEVRTRRRYGLFDVRTGQFAQLSTVRQKWDVFYTRIITSILNRTYKADETSENTHSINYWLGLSNGLMDVAFSDRLPMQTRRLIAQIKDDIASESFLIFDGLGSYGQRKLTMEQIARMDWLVRSVVGYLPDMNDLIETAQPLVRVHGIDPEDDPSIPDDEIARRKAACRLKNSQSASTSASSVSSSAADASAPASVSTSDSSTPDSASSASTSTSSFPSSNSEKSSQS